MSVVRDYIVSMIEQLIGMKDELGRLKESTIRLFKMTWPEYKTTFLAAGCVILLASVVPFAESYVLGLLLDELANGERSQQWNSPVTVLFVMLLVVGMLFVFAGTLQFFYKILLDKELFQFLAVTINRRVSELPLQIHDDPSKKDLITKVQEKAMWYASGFMQRMPYLLQNSGRVAIALVVFATLDIRISLLLLFAAVPRLYVNLRYNDMLWQVDTRMAEVVRKFWYARKFLVNHEDLTEIKLYQNVPFFVGRIQTYLGAIKDEEVAAERQYLIRQMPVLLFSEIITGISLWMLIVMVLGGTMAVGTFAFYFGALVTFRVAMNELIQNIGSQFRDGKFVTDMYRAFDLEDELPASQSTGIRLNGQIEEIFLDDVWFKYPFADAAAEGESQHPIGWVLQGLTLRIAGGSSIGIVAENGAGKSTLMKLLCRLYEPTRGRILVNGIDIREFDLQWWQAQVGILLQHFSRYEHLCIEDAIRLGRPDGAAVDMRAVEHAARLSDALGFILALEHKFKTIIGSGFTGARDFSGGQHQKIALARLFFRQAPISIFDEPTSALDGAAEARVFDSILEKMPGVTRFIISHRLYTLRKADQIVLLRDGRLLESGSHAELMEDPQGVYYGLYTAQAIEYQTQEVL